MSPINYESTAAPARKPHIEKPKTTRGKPQTDPTVHVPNAGTVQFSSAVDIESSLRGHRLTALMSQPVIGHFVAGNVPD